MALLWVHTQRVPRARTSPPRPIAVTLSGALIVLSVVKFMFVIFYFMHIKFSDRLTKLFVAIGFIWFFIMVGITMTDYLSRDWFVYHP